MEYGVSEKGFKIKTFLDIIADIENKYKVKLNRNDFKIDMYTPEGIHTEAIAKELADIWENLLELTNNSFLETAKGIWLDKIGELLGVSRKKGFYATGQIRITGKENTVIPLGTEVFFGNLKYLTNETIALEKTNGTDFYNDCYITSDTVGDVYNINANIQLNTELKETRVFTLTDIVGGIFGENDTKYRERLKQKIDTEKVATHSALIKALKKIENIKNVLILTPDTTPNTEPGTIKIYVDGTPTNEIFEIIADTKAAGILTIPDSNAVNFHKKVNVENVILDIYYNKISFIVPRIKVIVYDVIGEKDIRWTEPIKERIVNYINNLEVGESLDYMELYSEIRGIYEVRKIELQVAVDDYSEPTKHDYSKVFNIEISKRFLISNENIRVEYENE